MSGNDLSLAEARRIALAAQGFDRGRPAGRVDRRHLRRIINQIGLLQIDFVNVLVPAQYLVPFSRLGPYRRSSLDDLVYRGREFTEQWAHEASILPVETWPLLRHRRASYRVRPHGFEGFLKRHPGYVARVLDEVRKRGPLAAEDLAVPEGIRRRIPGAWLGTVPRAVLETHFGRGQLAVARRRSNFVREYDLTERLIPRKHRLERVELQDARRRLLLRAARAHGVGTVADLADYFRMPIREATHCVADLVKSGELRQVQVEGWKAPAYLHPEARRPRRIAAAALLSPFDPLIWHRPRVSRLFGFEYRIEIYVPLARRRYGYYVLPFLLGERLVARVDLKADRGRRRLLVQAAHLEPGADPGAVTDSLAGELAEVASWLDLEVISIGRRGNLARRLAAEFR